MKRTRKYHYKVGSPVVFKWCGNRGYGYVSELTKDKDGFATYTIRSTSIPGCIYYDMVLDDSKDKKSFISSTLKLYPHEIDKIKEHKARVDKRLAERNSSLKLKRK